MRRVTVVTADIIESRSAGDYKKSLRKLNELQHPMLLSPFTLSRGMKSRERWKAGCGLRKSSGTSGLPAALWS